MRKYFQFAAWLVVTMLGACSGGTESKEAADTAMEDKPVVRLASVTSRDVDQRNILPLLKRKRKII